MGKSEKSIHWLIATIVLMIIFFYGLYTTPPLPRFCISNNTGTEKLSVYNAEDGNCYVFLPSYADLDQVTITMSSVHPMYLDSTRLLNGMSCEEFELETPYTFSVGMRKTMTLWFYQSSNVATMHITTETGSTKNIHEDKNHEENVSVTLYTVDGELNFHTKTSILKGRGNYTWSLEKRPYLLKLSSAADLLDMGAASKWVLLANATDKTNLNNYLVHKMASSCGFSWTPECQFVDVYLNGEYKGLYLLTEKVETGVNRLNIDTTAGDFLCKIDLSGRWDSFENPFLTSTGRTVEISDPKILQQEDYINIQSHVNQMEQSILSGADLSAEELIDLDSWVRRYLIDEITANIDSDLASSYFYFFNGIFYAGPIWDYDLSFGLSVRNQEPNSFIAKNEKKSNGLVSPYYNALYKNASFFNRMIEVYQQEFLPIVQKMVDSEIQSFSNHISYATQMNSIRWESMYDTLQQSYPETARNTADLITYLERRIAFLNHAWLEDADYCTVQFELIPGEPYWNISVPKGCRLETSYVDIVSTVWIDSSTKEAYDFNQPIMSDLLLTPQPKGASSSVQSFTTIYYVTFLIFAVFFILFLSLVIIDVTHNQTKRGLTDEHIPTEVSSRTKICD